ncbi:hypothetical protein MTR67_024028 [Solanum verrucosum]|uniref:Uncharacterized protein n=1 Tax=Solanum verrucosum TaxID=315347 RepID=A0AAF0QWQ8_SOLVR|nr:hypothetical protein MTR67_024028 [Solanum verrucosum]
MGVGQHEVQLERVNPSLIPKPSTQKSLRIAESTWRVAGGSYFAFCSIVLSLEGNDRVGRKREQSAHRREVSQSSTMSPNDPEHDDAEGWCKTTMTYTNGRIAELIGDSD